jgi:sugar phosphate isomerase/epimerase
MKLGIFAKTFSRGTLEEVLDAVVDSGFGAIQFNMACAGLPSMPAAIKPGFAAHIGKAMRERGLEMAAVSGTFNMIHPDPAQQAEGLTRLEAIAQAAAAMGTNLVTLCTGTRDTADMWKHHPDNASPQAWHDLLATMEGAIQIAERHNLLLGIEPEVHNVVSSALKARQLLDQMGSARLKIVLDPANLYRVGELPDQSGILEEAFELLAPDLAMAHAKDMKPSGEYVAAGQGAVDFGRYAGLLRQAGFRGTLVAHGLAEGEATGVRIFLLGLTRKDSR